MDRELIAYFDRRFDESNDKTDRRFDEINRRLDDSDRRNDERFVELADRIDETSRSLGERIDKRIDETNRSLGERIDATGQRLDGRIDALRHDMNTGLRHNRVLIEDLTGKLEMVIEGVIGVRQELHRGLGEVRSEIREVQTRDEVGFVLLDRRLKAVEARDA